MRKHLYLLLLFYPSIWSFCQTFNTEELLDFNLNEREIFLKKIFFDDQRLRIEEFSLNNIQDETERKNQRQLLSDSMIYLDSINQIKIDFYLMNFQYPNPSFYKGVSYNAPWAVIQHSGSIDYRLKFLPIFLLALNSNYLTESEFQMYANRTLGMIYPEKKRYKKQVVALNKLIKKLNKEYDRNHSR